MKNHKIEISLERFQKACAALQRAAQLPQDNARMNIDTTIHRFEFTMSMCLNLLRNILKSKGVKVRYPKDVLREAYAGRLIDHEKIWLSVLSDINMSSEFYDNKFSDQVYERIKTYVPVFKEVMEKLSIHYL